MWRPYLKDRLIEQRDGYVVIVPVEAEPAIPLACPLCDHVLHTRDDELSHSEFGCCDHCARLWAHARREAWKTGWRPTAEQVKEAEAERLPAVLIFDVD